MGPDDARIGLRGLRAPVLIAHPLDWHRDYSLVTLADLLGLSDERLAHFDPLALNLIVAKDIEVFKDLEIGAYQAIANDMAQDFAQRCLPEWERYFDEHPDEFERDVRLFRLGMISQYLDLELGFAYNRDQRQSEFVWYTNPADLFLNGLLDTGEGTCANMAMLHVALAWRFGWPVSLAVVQSHFICRYDDGEQTFNMEATQAGLGGFKADSDEYLIRERHLSAAAVQSGSDLRALRPREMLGVFVSLRARHQQDVGVRLNSVEAVLQSEADWLLARHLFPASRFIFRHQMAVAALRRRAIFSPGEPDFENGSTCL